MRGKYKNINYMPVTQDLVYTPHLVFTWERNSKFSQKNSNFNQNGKFS